MRNIIALIITLLYTVSASAYDMGLGVGFRTNDADSTAPNTPVDGESTIQVGGIVWIDATEKLIFRTGFMYSQLNFEDKNSGSTVELAYLMIPATLMFKMADYGGIFGGVNVGLKASDDCSAGDCQDVDSTVTPITIGGYFKVAPQVAVEVFYESLSGEFVSGLENATSVGANVLFTFE